MNFNETYLTLWLLFFIAFWLTYFIVSTVGSVLNKGRNLAPIQEAAERGFLEIVEILLASGAQINIQFDKKTPLHYASKEGHLSIVKLLVYKGAKINITDWFVGTPLDYAVSYKKIKVIDFLRQNGGKELNINL
jgi:ankyrin repeat protein